MGELERQSQPIEGFGQQSEGIGKGGSVLVEVACDDRQTQLEVDGDDTIGEIRRQALTEMQIMASDPRKYLVIGPSNQPIDERRSVNEVLNEGQAMYFRLVPQVAFGIIMQELSCARSAPGQI